MFSIWSFYKVKFGHIFLSSWRASLVNIILIVTEIENSPSGKKYFWKLRKQIEMTWKKASILSDVIFKKTWNTWKKWKQKQVFLFFYLSLDTNLIYSFFRYYVRPSIDVRPKQVWSGPTLARLPLSIVIYQYTNTLNLSLIDKLGKIISNKQHHSNNRLVRYSSVCFLFWTRPSIFPWVN